MSVAEAMREKLVAAFAPCEIDIVDESAKHAGHAGARPEGETHFRVWIVSDRFERLTRVERQRAVHAVVTDELSSRIHALSLSAFTPSEVEGRAHKGTK